MSIEAALSTIVTPIFAALTPVPPFYWGRVPSGVDEYVVLSHVGDGIVPEDDYKSDNKQFTVVTKSGMVRARVIAAALFSGIQRLKGVYSGMTIHCIAYVRSVELPDSTTGEDIIACEYLVNYEGGI